ncbi:putative eukaryotic translation initiation factor eIF1a-like protein [Coleophoma cylindrospora]|uniref:Putative eukaryotic translation initiation factor eIF1a-like protein n=1 Tax=Coleophoma cylindrospora TaxID=1849047 RepID=A0A3D8R6L6_9HELO|nr:putative eukaryotic translation initiation factor eIF1a-like protein [Coleophoma cylindrospora]
MGRPKRNVFAAAEETSTPPSQLTATQHIARVVKAAGNSLYSCCLPDKTTLLAELPSRFRNTIWIRNGGYVLIDTKDADVRENKIGAEIINVVRDEHLWRKESYWPKEFVKASSYAEDSDDEESTVGKMPPSDDSDEEE